MNLTTTKNIVRKILHKAGYVILRENVVTKLRGGEDFVTLFYNYKPYTMVPPGRSLGLYKAVEYIVANKLEGDLVECGVWRGGQSMIAAKVLLEREGTRRKLWLYDTFSGMSAPTELDIKIKTGALAGERWRQEQRETRNEWCYASLEEVKRNMEITGYPEDKVVYVRGKVEDTIPKMAPEKIALLRLDTDWYQSTAHELKHLFPLLAEGGILIIDDYYSWSGARKAVDEYFKNRAGIVFFDVDEARFGIKLCQRP
ncbi:MAG: TylF/MycF/NovP-related O-methyltransferase [Candidatus Adlerbacteria bacterium]|nr:TylF/MycF/NovP-related O-methyltransferase [Candidatus Adlerbacteria bacterium]